MNNNVLITRIQHILILNSQFVSDVGLLNGKIGVVLAFAHLYKYTCNEIYYDFMSELLDDVLKQVYRGLDIGFTSGFSGIGWGIEYLLQSRFVEGVGVEICKEIDEEIMKFDPRRMTDISLENGLEGLLHYVLIRIRGSKDVLPFDELYFFDLYERIKILLCEHRDVSFIQLGRSYVNWYETRSTPDYLLNVLQFVSGIPIADQSLLSSSSLGLRNGLSGLLLKQLLV